MRACSWRGHSRSRAIREGERRLQRSLDAVEECRPRHSGSARSTSGVRQVAVLIWSVQPRAVDTSLAVTLEKLVSDRGASGGLTQFAVCSLESKHPTFQALQRGSAAGRGVSHLLRYAGLLDRARE